MAYGICCSRVFTIFVVTDSWLRRIFGGGNDSHCEVTLKSTAAQVSIPTVASWTNDSFVCFLYFTACSPLPSDSFFNLINRERLCLKEEICKELDKSYKELAIIGRVESEMKEYEASSNPAERVLEKLKALYPRMKLEEFQKILVNIKRLDVVEVIHKHHLSCTLCRRNRFDSKA